MAGISRFKTNHSLRATVVTRLYQVGIGEQLIMDTTGHHSFLKVFIAISAQTGAATKCIRYSFFFKQAIHTTNDYSPVPTSTALTLPLP